MDELLGRFSVVADTFLATLKSHPPKRSAVQWRPYPIASPSGLFSDKGPAQKFAFVNRKGLKWLNSVGGVFLTLSFCCLSWYTEIFLEFQFLGLLKAKIL
jgi:hypothetical protein